jgi:hypothetical protein
VSKTAFDFLDDSPLLDKRQIETEYQGLDERDLLRELEQYRGHVLSRDEELRGELAGSDEQLSIYFDSSNRSHPSVDQLKQSALYFDRAVVDDPLFSFARPASKNTSVFNQYLGFNPPAVNRNALARLATFMAAVRPMAAGHFLTFAPISAALEPPDETPITYSETLCAERIPEELRDWILHRAEVAPARQHADGTGWYSRPGDPFEPSRAICITFDGYEQPFVYFLFATRAHRHPDDPTRFTLEQWMPETPPSQEQFDIWVRQSINQVGGRILEHLRVDFAHAAFSRSMLLTDSAFLGDLLNLTGVGKSLHEDLARLALRLELPVLANASVEDLMSVRNHQGEAFHSFRLALQRQLRELRTMTDQSDVLKKLENLQHELEEVQVAEVRREVRRVQREVLRAVVIGAASLAAVVPSQGWSLSLLVAAGASAYKAGTAFRDQVKEHPAYFLWKLKESTRR